MAKKQTPRPIRILRKNVPPGEIAHQYLKHEFRKLFADVKDRNFWKTLDKSLDKLKERIGKDDFWQLLSGVAEGYLQKWVYRVLTDSVYKWRLEEIALDDIRMTGMGPFMDPILEEAGWRPSQFAKIWKSHPKYSQAPEAQGIKPFPERDEDPIFLRERDNELRVFDGMRRVCIAVLENRKSLNAFVGRIRNPSGKMMINKDKVLFLRALYDEAPHKDLKLLEAIKTIFKAYIKFYRNGKQVVSFYLKKWQRDPKLRPIAEEILSDN